MTLTRSTSFITMIALSQFRRLHFLYFNDCTSFISTIALSFLLVKLQIPWFYFEAKCSLTERTPLWFTASSLRVCFCAFCELSLIPSIDGVFTTIDDVHATYVLGKDENGEDITVSNLKVIKLLQSLWSRGYVKKTYSWLLAV